MRGILISIPQVISFHAVVVLVSFFQIDLDCFGPCLVDAATSSGILKAKQKLRRTFNSDKLGGIAFTKFSKLTMCSA